MTERDNTHRREREKGRRGVSAILRGFAVVPSLFRLHVSESQMKIYLKQAQPAGKIAEWMGGSRRLRRACSLSGR